jgi:hypothetical protein
LNGDELLGVVILVGCVVGIPLYGWLLFPVGPLIVLRVTAILAAFALLGILGWMGYALATTPKPIESMEMPPELRSKPLMRRIDADVFWRWRRFCSRFSSASMESR